MNKIARFISFALIAVMLCGLFTFAVSAANPIVVDFSKYENIDDIATAKAGDGDYQLVTDNGSYVLYAECIAGFDPNDAEGTATKGDPNIQLLNFKDLGVDADTYQWMKMSVKNPSNAPGFEVHFSSPLKGMSVATSITFDIKPNTDYTEYIYNVTEACKKYYPKRPADVDDPDNYPDYWHGLIDIFRLDFMYYEESGGHAREGDKIYIEYIAFFESEQAAKDFVFTPARGESQIKPTEAAAEDAGDAGDENAAGSSSTDDDSGNNMVLIIVIAAVVIVAVVVVVVIVSKGKKK